MKFEFQGAAMAQKKSAGKRKPLRSFSEMADEFGVPKNKLSSLIRFRNGPAPAMVSSNTLSRQTTYYDPDVLRKWWREVGGVDQ